AGTGGRWLPWLWRRPWGIATPPPGYAAATTRGRTHSRRWNGKKTETGSRWLRENGTAGRTVVLGSQRSCCSRRTTLTARLHPAAAETAARKSTTTAWKDDHRPARNRNRLVVVRRQRRQRCGGACGRATRAPVYKPRGVPVTGKVGRTRRRRNR
ncbi:unnamed protein product, partial [Ectocarpus fasciculatus]